MKNPPEGWPRISSALFYDDAAAAIDWLTRAFGFAVQERVEDEQGRIVHSQLVLDGGLIMVGQTDLQPRPGVPSSLHRRSPARTRSRWPCTSTTPTRTASGRGRPAPRSRSSPRLRTTARATGSTGATAPGTLRDTIGGSSSACADGAPHSPSTPSFRIFRYSL